jgi:alpha-amylase
MLRFLPVLALLLPCAAARPWTDDVLYFVLTDRFHDGDPANNVPAGSDPELHDPAQKDLGKYQGGDLRGLELAIRAGYFNELGVTALWITPPVRNVWRSGRDGDWKSGYHGYWAQDFLDIDPHLTSATTLDGRAYAEGAEGRMQHYRDFVALAHSKGLKVVQDAVLNHAGPVFYYDADGNGRFDRQVRDEWMQPFKAKGYHGNAVWADLPRWNMKRAMPDGPRRLLGREIATRGVLADLSSYGRKGCSGHSLGATGGEEIECDFYTLRDLWTAPGSAHFDRLVNEYVEIYAFYLLDVGVDGLRIDTVKHIHHAFWDVFTERLRERLGSRAKDKLLFGEVYDDDPETLGDYTWRSDWPARKDPCLDSLLNFDFCAAARSYLRHEGEAHGKAREIEQAMKDLQEGKRGDGRPFYNPAPGLDGTNALRKSVTFIENHDGLNRFRVAGVTEKRSNLAQALVMSLPGIPCIYYGAEVGLHDSAGRLGKDSETGRLTLFPRDSAPPLANLREQDSFKTIARMAKLRREIAALRSGRFEPLWVDSPSDGSDDGVFAFSRVDGEERVMVILNASGKERRTILPTGFAPGISLRAESISPVVRKFVVDSNGTAAIPVPAGSILICRPETGR